jgi:DNA-binding NarL/FixJ family response regulator
MPPPAGLAGQVASHVLVVDDHRVFAEALAHRLRGMPSFAGAQVACTVAEARAAAGAQGPDLVLLNPELEGGSGLDLIGHLDELPRRPRVVVLDNGTEPLPAVRRRLIGSGGWVSKESRFEDLLAAMLAPDGAPLWPAAAPGPVSLELATGRSAGSPGSSGAPSLSQRQADVLGCLVQGMTRAQVATHLRMSRHTVRDHVRHLFRITGVTTTRELVAGARAVQDTEGPRLRVVADP